LLCWSTVGLFVAAAFAPSLAAAQGTASISGTVSDSASGRPIPSVQVLVTGTTRGAITDESGRYTLRGLSGGMITVRAQRIGYAPSTRQVSVTDGANTSVDFRLGEVARVLSEVVTVGYGTDTRANVSSAVTQVQAQDIQNTPVAGLDAALTGKAAGVQVTQNAGNPGAGISVRIRGSSSISASNQPLYVVDGIVIQRGDFSQLDLGGQDITGVTGINPDEVESITVLKDAAAAAIYGSRGSNGVVMVTTKRGRSGRPRLNINAYTGIQDVAHKVDMLTGPEYVEYMSEAARNDGYTDQDILDFVFGTSTLPTGLEGSNWQNEVFRKAPVTDVTLGVSGGTDRIQYFVSGSMFDQMGVAYGSGYKRQSARVNLDFQATEKLGFKSSVNLSREDHARIEGDNTIDGEVTNAIAEQPWLPARDPATGFFTSPDDGLAYSNPLALGKLDAASSRSLRALASLEGTYNFSSQLRWTTRGGADVLNLRDLRWESPRVLGTYAAGVSGVARQGDNTGNRYVVESFLNWDLPANGLQTLNATAGTGLEWESSENSYLRGESFGNEQFRYVGNAAKVTAYDGGATDARLASFFARANYSLMERYLATAGVRLDGSSRFGLNNRYGTFPSASIGWVATKEPWLQSLANFVDLKLRASLGFTGNQAIASNFAPLATFGRANYGDEGGLTPSTLGNPDLRWESTREFDVGFDLSALQGRMTFIGDAYVKKTSDLLVLRPIPGTSGYTSVWSNVGNMENKGLEAQITTRNFVSEGDGFNWTTDFNIAHNANKVLKLYNGQPFTSGIRSVNRVQEGAPLGAFYTYVVDKVDPATGDLLLKDLDGDGTITANDRAIVGSPYPKYTGGLSNELTWMGFNFHSFLQFSKGAQIYNAIGIFADDAGYNLDNKYKRVLRRWQKPGDITDQPRASFDGTSNGIGASSRYIEDGSYLRIQEVTLGYSLPKRFASLAGMQDTRIYVSGRNLHTFTNYIGFNPDVNSNGSGSNISLGTDFYASPIARSYTFGITGNW
jgi:TonB-linked SusC/RagA family outer membrane protein